MTWNASYATLTPGGIPDGRVARTVDAGNGIYVDVAEDGTVLGVEAIGDGANLANWINGLVALAMQGRLRVTPPSSSKSQPD